MYHHHPRTLETASPGRWTSFLAALAVACLPPLAHEARAHASAPPAVPAGLEVMPATDCAEASDVGKKELVPYTADYFFYTPSLGGRDTRASH
jgi:hypothetical protein